MGIVDTVGSKRIYLDANIFIYALEGFAEFKQTLTELFLAIDDSKVQAVTGDLTLAEVLVKPLRDSNLAKFQSPRASQFITMFYKQVLESLAQ